MAFVVEVCRVVSALEILGAERFVVDINETLRSGYQLDGVPLAGLCDKAYNLFKSWTVHLPRCYKSHLCFGIILLDAL